MTTSRRASNSNRRGGRPMPGNNAGAYWIRQEQSLMTAHSTPLRTFALGALALAWLSGCSSDMDKLQAQVAEIKSRPGERIEPLPQIKAYESFTYNAASMRSPFVPSAPTRSDVANAVRPDSKRSREFLEQFPLDTMQMVGT